MKKATFRRLEIQIEKTSSYGHYKLTSVYKGQLIEITITDSEIYDYLDDDSNKKKHQEAKRSAYLKIKNSI